MMQMKKIKNSDDALVAIVATFLITGLIVIVISMIQTVYVPNWMEQTEAEHMEMVADQFSQLKFAIDTQSALKQTDTPISTSITLGNKEIPFLMSSRAYGSLEVLSDNWTVTITSDTDPPISHSLSIIKYSSVNTYFLNQAYIYEAGAVILSQSEGDIMSIKPAFSVIKEDNIDISFTIINISTIGEKRSISGYGTYPIQTEYSDSDEPIYEEINNVSNIIINTNYQNSWHKFINNTLINSGLEYSTNFLIEMADNEVNVRFLDLPDVTVTVNLKVIKIGAQIAPGWIENIRGD